jgi:transcriptional regulator with XRE-family HTH domain
MATSQRLFDRGTELARAALMRLGRELRDARRDRGLSLAAAARAAGISTSEMSRIERGESRRVPLMALHRCAVVVGLDLSSRLYPGPGPLRDAAHARLLADLRGQLHRSLHWATEVPLPISGDLRAWDGFVSGTGWRYGVEAETSPRDAQALNRRIQLKARDGGVDGVLLVLRDNRSSRAFVREAAAELGPSFPQPGARVLELLGAGIDPGGSAIVFVARIREPSRPTGQRIAVKPRGRISSATPPAVRDIAAR